MGHRGGMDLHDALSALAGGLNDVCRDAAGGRVRFGLERGSSSFSAAALDDHDGVDHPLDLDFDAFGPLEQALADEGHMHAVGELRVRDRTRWDAVVCTSPQLGLSQHLTRRVRDAVLPFTPPRSSPDLTPAQADELVAVWTRIAPAMEAAGPADEAALSRLADSLGFPVPSALRRLLELVNGADPLLDEDMDDEPDLDALPLPGWSLLSCTEIADAHRGWSALAAGGIYDRGRPGRRPPGRHPAAARPSWVAAVRPRPRRQPPRHRPRTGPHGNARSGHRVRSRHDRGTDVARRLDRRLARRAHG